MDVQCVEVKFIYDGSKLLTMRMVCQEGRPCGRSAGRVIEQICQRAIANANNLLQVQLLGLDLLEDAPLLAQLGDLKIILLRLLLEGFALHIKFGQRSPTHVVCSNLTPDLGVLPRGVGRNNDALL